MSSDCRLTITRFCAAFGLSMTLVAGLSGEDRGQTPDQPAAIGVLKGLADLPVLTGRDLEPLR